MYDRATFTTGARQQRMEIKTLNDIYRLTCTIDRPVALKTKKNGQWVDTTVPQLRDTVRYFSNGLRSLGVKPGDRVAILSENRPEWAMADFAILAAGAVTVPIYPTLLGWQIEYILNDAGVVAVVCSTDEQYQKIAGVKSHVPSINNLILCDVPAGGVPEGVLRFEDVVETGRKDEESNGRARFDELLVSRTPADLATLVYTSGTTGNPKGAMLTPGNITSNVVAVNTVLPVEGGTTSLSILPLSHILQRAADYAYFYKGVTIAYAESVVKVGENLQEIRPEYFAAVPRLFEKMRAKVMDGVAEKSALQQKMFRWALGVAEERLHYRLTRPPLPRGLALRAVVAHKTRFNKIL